MKIAIVGPAHPYKGGIVHHTTELANRLEQAGHQVTLVSWLHQYPFFYPGQQFVPEGKPELAVPSDVRRVLSWKSPYSWWHWGKKLQAFDQVFFVWWVPTIQGPVYRLMLRALNNKARSTLICHNVLPHEGKPGDKALARSVLNHVDEVITHAAAQSDIARELSNTPLKTIGLPPVVPPVKPREGAFKLQRQLLFWGIVRPYKGVDVLIKALAQLPDIRLTVAGEFWGDEQYDKLLDDLKLRDRVTLKKGYVDFTDLPDLFNSTDALVLPYRGGTASYNVAVGHHFGKPVIATTSGSLATQVNDGVDGLLCAPDDVTALAETINKFYRPGVAKSLTDGVPTNQINLEWQAYIDELLQ
jgi:glycosyltransferase involved in cell wall biosynthesis